MVRGPNRAIGNIRRRLNRSDPVVEGVLEALSGLRPASCVTPRAGRSRRRWSATRFPSPQEARGCCWVAQWIPPPPAARASMSSITMSRLGNISSSRSKACHRRLDPRTGERSRLRCRRSPPPRERCPDRRSRSLGLRRRARCRSARSRAGSSTGAATGSTTSPRSFDSRSIQSGCTSIVTGS